MALHLEGRARILIGAVSICIYAGIAFMAWDGPRWISFLAAGLGSYRAWLWFKEVRRVLGADDE